MENFGWVETFFDHGKRLLECRRVQSRSRGTRTIPYSHWGSVYVRVREHPHEESTPSEVLWTAAGIVGRVREWRIFRRRPKADQRDQWNQGRVDQVEYPRVRVNNESWALNQFNSQGKDDYSVQRSNSEKETTIFWRNSSISNDELRTTKVNLGTEEQRNIEISNVVDEKSKRINNKRTFLQQGITIPWQQNLSRIRISFLYLQFGFHCHPWAFLLSSRWSVALRRFW